MTRLCQWFEVPRRTLYYKPIKSAPKAQELLETPIKALIEQDPSYGYRTVAGLLNMNKNTVQRIFQIRGWQVKKRLIGFRPRVEALPSVAVFLISAGRLTFAASGRAEMAGWPWRW
jgi:putative transposase